MAFNKLTNLTQKTVKQARNQVISGLANIENVKKITENLTYEILQFGAFVEFQDVIGVKAAYFDKYAFIQSDSNLAKTGTGIQDNNRQEVDAQWLQQFNFVLPNPKQDASKDYFVTNYMNGAYADIMVDGKFTAEFIDEAFKQMDNSFDLLYANRIYFGVDKPLSASDTGHYKGLKDLISIAKSATAVTDVDNIVLIGGATKATNIDLSDTDISDLNAFSQLNNLLFKVSNVNDCFTVGLDASDTTRWISSGTVNVKILCWNSYIEKVKAKNYQFFKDLMNLYDSGILIPLRESTLNVEQVNRSSTVNGSATPLAITPASLGLALDELLYIDANSWIGYKYGVDADGKEYTINNITTTFRKVELSRVADYLPTGISVVIKAPSAIDLAVKVPVVE